MKCQILFSGKNKKNISKCRLLKILPRVLSVNTQYTDGKFIREQIVISYLPEVFGQTSPWSE